MQPTLVFLPGKFYGQRNLVSYSPRGCKGSDTTEQLTHTHTHTHTHRAFRSVPGTLYQMFVIIVVCMTPCMELKL